MPLWRKVLFDGQDARISSLAHSTPGAGYTTITLTSAVLSTDLLNGRELVVLRPNNAGDRYITATINDTTTTTIVVVDAGGASAPVYAALNGATQGFVVFDFNDKNITNAPTYSTGGNWTTTGAYSSDTTWTDSNAAFVAYQEGWSIEVDAEFPQYTLIAKSRTATTIVHAGDGSNLDVNSTRYRIYAPPGVDASDGAHLLDVNEGGSRYLYAGYRFMLPQVGYNDSGTIRGAQTGNNKSGNYHCWNREYDPSIGRWTTPDPKASPYWNLLDYCRGDPSRRSDATGLHPAAAAAAAAAGLTVTQVILLIGAGAFAACLIWGDCARVIEKAIREAAEKAKDLLKKSDPPAPPKPGIPPKPGDPPPPPPFIPYDPFKDLRKEKPRDLIKELLKDSMVKGKPWPKPKPDKWPPPPKPDDPPPEETDCTCEGAETMCIAGSHATPFVCSQCAQVCKANRLEAQSKGWTKSVMHKPDYWPHDRKVTVLTANGVGEEVGPCPNFKFECPTGVK